MRRMVFALAVVGVLVAASTEGRSEDSVPNFTIRPSVDLQNMALSELLRLLIVTHPCQEVREELHELIESGRLKLNFNADLLGENGDMGLCVIPTDGGVTVPVLIIAPAFLTDVSISDQYRQLVIWHQFSLLRQLVENRARLEYFYPDPVDRVWTEPEIREFFEVQAEAYLAEAELARRINACDLIELCSVYAATGEAGVRLKLARQFADQMPSLAPHRALLSKLAAEPARLTAAARAQ